MAETQRGGCTICGRPVEARWRPFCSKRCSDVDLGRWLGERYVVSVPADDESDTADGDDGNPPAGRA